MQLNHLNLTKSDYLQGRKDKKRKPEASLAHKGSLNGLAFSNTSRHLITYGCFDGRLRKWSLLDGHNTKTPFEPGPKLDIKIHMPIATSEKTTDLSNEMVFVPTKSNIRQLSLETGQKTASLGGHFKTVTSLAFSPANLEIFSGSNDRAILIWDCIDNSAFQDHLDNRDTRKSSAFSGLQDGNSRRHNDLQLTQDAWSSSDDES